MQILASKHIRTIVTGIVGLLFILPPLWAQKRTFHCRKASQVIEFMNQSHYAPRAIDSAFDAIASRHFVNTLDPLGIFFTEKAAGELVSACPDLASLDCNEKKNFMDDIVSIYRRSLLGSGSMMNAFFDSPADYHKKDSLCLPEPYSVEYPETIEGLKNNLEKYLKFQLLRYYFSTFRSGDSTFVRNEENFNINMDSLKAGILKRENCKINHLLDYPGGFEEYVFSMYLNVVTSSFDPHSNYFSMNDKDLFVSSLSRNSLSFGADLDQNDDGEIIISRLIPGGPAWRSGEVSQGDVLTSIRFPGKAPIDLICSSVSEIRDLLYNSGSDRVEITVRSGIGQVRKVELSMENLSAAENVVYGFILEGARRIGYISLPGFYTEPDKNDPMGSASDLVKEIERLKEDGMEGLILDVRNNGGGSVMEAVDMAGIFLDAGPLCLYRKAGGKPVLIKDLNPGTVYDGPLVLMINGYSASASEILAGILQDYHRAVVVGTPSFGKASGQVIAPLGNPGMQNSGLFLYDEPPTDFLKITTTRYYRLNGTSHQASGIMPDILLPEHAGYVKIKESEFPSALPADTVHQDVRFEPCPALPLDALQEKSKRRILSNPRFMMFNTLNDSIRPLYAGQLCIPLEFQAFKSEYLKNKSLFDRMANLKSEPGDQFNVSNTAFDEKELAGDEYRTQIRDEMIKKLSGDLFLEEAFLVVTDLLDLTENKEGTP